MDIQRILGKQEKLLPIEPEIGKICQDLFPVQGISVRPVHVHVAIMKQFCKISQLTFACSNSIIETLGKGVKYVQLLQIEPEIGKICQDLFPMQGIAVRPVHVHVAIMKQFCKISQLTFACSNSTVETLGKGVKYVQC